MKTKRTWIYVTRRDIADGSANDCSLCPVALAIKRRLEPNVRIWVGPPRAVLCIGDTRHWIHLPESAIVFIGVFDYGRPVAPIRFQLDIPVRFLRRAA